MGGNDPSVQKQSISIVLRFCRDRKAVCGVVFFISFCFITIVCVNIDKEVYKCEWLWGCFSAERQVALILRSSTFWLVTDAQCALTGGGSRPPSASCLPLNVYLHTPNSCHLHPFCITTHYIVKYMLDIHRFVKKYVNCWFREPDSVRNKRL